MTDKTHLPLVSVIIPTYNYGRYLPRAIESCLNQSYTALEIIVVDDGSTDNTQEVAKRYQDRIVYIRQENGGVSAARNKGLEQATGAFIAFLDADDYITEDAIQTRLEALTKNPEAGVVITEAYSKKGESLSYRPSLKKDIVSNRFYEELLMGRFPLTTSTSLIQSHIAKQHQFPVGLSNGEDIVYFAKLFFVTPVCYLTKPTDIAVWHEDSLRHNIGVLKEQGAELIKAIFDDPFYGGALDYLRKGFTANRYLEIFKKLSRYGEKKIARGYYWKALLLKPHYIFKIEYLIRFIKTYF